MSEQEPLPVSMTELTLLQNDVEARNNRIRFTIQCELEGLANHIVRCLQESGQLDSAMMIADIVSDYRWEYPPNPRTRGENE